MEQLHLFSVNQRAVDVRLMEVLPPIDNLLQLLGPHVKFVDELLHSPKTRCETLLVGKHTVDHVDDR